MIDLIDWVDSMGAFILRKTKLVPYPNDKIIVLLIAAAVTLQASPRTSGSYELTLESTGPAGERSTSATYALDSSTGGIGGIAVSPGIVANIGYTGQLYDPVSLEVSASPTTINEGESRQLSATAALDDATALSLDAEDVVWNVVSGPLSAISSSGLATAGVVYEDTSATARGTYFNAFGQLELIVLNVIDDDFAEYAGDAIDDDWQVRHSGEPPNPLAAPDQDADGDNRDNEFEFLTGFDPNDPEDSFEFILVDVSGTNVTFELNKVIPDRIYTVRSGTNLLDYDETLMRFSVDGERPDHTEQDSNATGVRKFYIIEVSKP